MSNQVFRGKGVEIAVIATYLVISLQRVWSEFQKSFPLIITDLYLPDLDKKTQEVNNLVSPQMETVELKNTTNKLYSSMDSLKEPADRVSGYLKVTKGAIPISAKDFGLTPLLQKIRSRDAEGVLQYLRNVINNLKQYHQPLIEQGLTEDVINSFAQALNLIEENNRKQYEIITKRKAIVSDNINIINDLYKTITDICQVGKLLYKGKDPVKVQEYTYSELLKKVRIVKKEK
jgi:hypothetical protein